MTPPSSSPVSPPATPPASPPATSLRTSNPWRLRLGIVLAVLAVIGAAVPLQRARERLGQAERTLASTQAADAVRQGELVTVRDELRTTRREGAGLASALRRTGSQQRSTDGELWARTVERDELGRELGGAQARLSTNRERLAGEEQRISLQGQQVEVLHRCLDGVAQATGHAAVGRQREAVAALRSASPDCTTAETSVTAGGRAPVFPFDFADPFVLRVGDRYYGYSTNAGAGQVQTIVSPNLSTWEWVGEALPTLPAWADRYFVWAPSVLARGRSFVLYYSTLERASGRKCISHAVSRSPRGPFVDDSGGPLVCQQDLGGSIDPSPFTDGDGTPYLVWKSEGEVVGGTAGLWAQRLAGDGRSLVDAPAQLLAADQGWEGGVVEGPSMLRHDGRLSLFYSGGAWDTRAYGVGWAECASPLGPCTKPFDRPLLGSAGTTAGPGGQEFFVDSKGGPWIAFHAWAEPDIGYPHRRRLHVERLDFSAGRPQLAPR